MSQRPLRFETLSVHAGYKPDPTTKAVAVPLYQTAAYAFDNAQHGADLFDLKVPGNIYTRIMNPTQNVLEQRVAALEGGIAALALASGQAAVTYSVLTIAEAGDNIVASSALYGGTYNLFAHTLPQYGIQTRFADYRKPESFEPNASSALRATSAALPGSIATRSLSGATTRSTTAEVGCGRARTHMSASARRASSPSGDRTTCPRASSAGDVEASGA